MKKILSAFFALCLLVPATYGQKEDYRRQKALGISFFFNDFITPERIRATSLSHVIRDKSFAKTKQMSSGLAITYFKGLTNHIDFAASIEGSYVNYPLPGKVFDKDNFLLASTAQVNLKMTSEQYWFQPYIIAGVGAHRYRKYYGVFMPLGLGIKVNIFDEAHLFITSTYRVPVTTETANYHFQHGFGIAGAIGKKKK